MSKLIYIDPFCSGLQVRDCKSIKDIKKLLANEGLESDNCCDIIYYAFVDKDGKVTQGKLDFS